MTTHCFNSSGHIPLSSCIDGFMDSIWQRLGEFWFSCSEVIPTIGRHSQLRLPSCLQPLRNAKSPLRKINTKVIAANQAMPRLANFLNRGCGILTVLMMGINRPAICQSATQKIILRRKTIADSLSNRGGLATSCKNNTSAKFHSQCNSREVEIFEDVEAAS
jgi:hypothetical protein